MDPLEALLVERMTRGVSEVETRPAAALFVSWSVMQRDGDAAVIPKRHRAIPFEPMAPAPEWLDLEAAGRRLGVSPRSVQRLIDTGELAATRKPVLVRAADLTTYLERCRIRPGALAHLDHNASQRPSPDVSAPLTRAGRPNRRYGRRTSPS